MCLSIMLLRIIHIVGRISSLLLCIAEQFCIIWLHCNLFILSLVHGHLDFSPVFGYFELSCYEHLNKSVWTYDFTSVR